MKYPCVIAARMGSSRLPGKTLMRIEGREMIGMIIDRVKISKNVNDILIATTDLPEDDKLVTWAKKEGIATFRGQSSDVLGRISDAVEYIGTTSFIEVLGDNPLIESRIIDEVCDKYKSSNYDYVSLLTKEYPNFWTKDSCLFPVGIRAQIMSAKAIKKASKLAKSLSHREHATTYIIDNPDDFKIGLVEAREYFKELNMPKYTYAVNVEANLEMIRYIVKTLKKFNGDWNLKDVINLTNKDPHVISLMGNEAVI